MHSTVAFALVVVQHPEDDRFVLVHEKQDRGWWLPGGGVDAGQTFAEAAVREAEEEAGVKCELTGVLRIENDCPGASRLRVIFHARPIDADMPLKSMPDHHSRGARWVTLNEVVSIARGRVIPGVPAETCKLRGMEPLQWFNYLAKGGYVFPLSVLDMVRLGRVEEWRGPGEPPRAVYPTQFLITLACTRGEQVVVTESGQLPALDLVHSSSPNKGAQAFADSLGFGPVLGILQVRHTLNVRHKSSKYHAAVIQMLYQCQAMQDEFDAGAAGCRWVPVSSLRNVVVAHNNSDLRVAVQGRISGQGTCKIVDKDCVEEAVTALKDLPGSPLICTSTFPLDRLPLVSQAVVWSKKAATDMDERRRLMEEGAAYVALDATPSLANFGALFAELDSLCQPWPIAMTPQPLNLIDDESAAPVVMDRHAGR